MNKPTLVDIAGTGVPVRILGEGPPVLFIHGLYVNDHLWDEVATRIAPARTCYLPTLPLGTHSTPADAGWRPSLDDLARLVTGLLEELDLHEATLVGNDTGGGLVLLALGSGHPALTRITRVVLTNCDSYDHFPPPRFSPLVAMARATPQLARAALWMLLATRLGRKLLLSTVTQGGHSLRADTLLDASRLDGAVRVTAALRPDERQRQMRWLEELDLAVHLVWGEKDLFFPIEDAERLHRAILGARLTTVPDAKTYVPLDSPEAVAAAITAS